MKNNIGFCQSTIELRVSGTLCYSVVIKVRSKVINRSNLLENKKELCENEANEIVV